MAKKISRPAPYLSKKIQRRGNCRGRIGGCQARGVFAKQGIASVTLAFQELYTAAAAGIIDACVYGGTATVSDNKFYESFKYYITPPVIGQYASSLLVNKAKFEALPYDLNRIVRTAFDFQGTNRSVWCIANDNRRLMRIRAQAATLALL